MSNKTRSGIKPEEDRRIVTSEVKKLLSRIDSLPTISVVAHRVGELVADPDSDARSISRVLRADQSLTAKVLKLANSPYYAIPGGVSDVSRAISFLGFNTLYQLVLSASVLSVLDGTNHADLSPRELWKHALGCAVLAEIIARHLKFPEPEVCFTAGLLHDIGKVALLQAAPYQFQSAVAEARARGITLHEATAQVGLPTHESVGKRLAEKWRFPMPIRVAIEHHRFAEGSRLATLAQNLKAFVDVTALANILIRKFNFGDPGDDLIPEIDPNLLERLNMTSLQAESFRDEFLRSVERSSVLLDLIG